MSFLSDLINILLGGGNLDSADLAETARIYGGNYSVEQAARDCGVTPKEVQQAWRAAKADAIAEMLDKKK